MRRVLYITNLPAPYRIAFFEQLCQGQEIDLTVLYERSTAATRNEKWKDETSARCFREVFLPAVKIGDEASLSLKVLSFLNRKYDVIILGGYSSPTMMLAITYMHLRRIKFGITCDGILPKEDSKQKKALKTWLVSAASFWLSSGRVTTAQLLKYGAVEERIYEYPFSSVREAEIVDPEELTPERKRAYKDLIGCREEKAVLYVGRLIHEKGVDVLLDAFKRLNAPNTRLIIVGGDTGRQCEDERISFVEFQKKEELSAYYRAADVLVLPTRGDVWGLVVNEALANGVPVVTTDRCGAGLQMLRNGVNGYVISSEDAQAMSRAIASVLTGSDMKQEAIKTARDYTIEKMAACTQKIICTV